MQVFVVFCSCLPPSTYQLTAELSGSKTATLTSLRILGNQVSRVDVTLEIGESVQTAEFTGVAPIFQPESTQTGGTLTASNLTALPLKSRNFVALTLLAPGAVSPNPEATNNHFGARPFVNRNRGQARPHQPAGRPMSNVFSRRRQPAGRPGGRG